MTSARVRRSVAAVAVAVLGIGAVPGSASAVPGPGPAAARDRHQPDRRPNFDARTPDARTLTALRAAPRPAGVTTLHDGLGDQGIVDVDPETGTARRVAKLDGFLTAPSTKPARQIAGDYLAAHPDVFGLSVAEVAALRLRKDYLDIDGTHHLSLEQMVGDVPVFGNGVRADVTREGRLIQVTGAPVASLPTALGSAGLTAAQARATAAKDAGLASSRASDPTKLVAFATRGGARLAWQTLSTKAGYLHVIDAATGRVLYRQDLLLNDNAPAATVWSNYPGAPRGGTQQRRSLAGWIAPGATTLSGNSAHVFLDVNDDDQVNPGEEVAPNRPGDWRFPFKDFSAQVGAPCAADKQCSWDPKAAYSWEDNARQNAAQLFYYVSRFHDHLAKAPIGFNRAAGSYETADGDPIEVNALDGADTAAGFPDYWHADNANMLPTPDGVPGRMQMYLFPDPTWPEDPFLASNSGDEADVVYHEYTHGMSNRLVVDASGNSTLTGIQGYSMGEAWSDWYAFDDLVAGGFQKDTAKPGEVLVGRYVGNDRNIIRTQPLDCPVGAAAGACPGTEGAGSGGYTYGDFGKIIGFPEPHADGEIWAETLWDLRAAIGSKLSESLITRAMELSPANPSFLDMRNSILMADKVSRDGRDQGKIWKVFSGRGMGWFAADLDGDDVVPIEDFSMPPARGAARTSVSGTVTDSGMGAPLAGAVVTFAGHSSGFAGSYQAATDAQGRYAIAGVRPGGTYPEVSATLPGYETVMRDVPVHRGVNQVDWKLRRDWAATSGGGTVTDFNGDDYSEVGCGPDAAIDMSPKTGWSTDATYGGDGRIDPRHMVVRLPAAVDVSEIAINPSGNCGDDVTSSTGDYRVETSADGQTWTVAAEGHFGAGNRNKMNAVPLAAGSTSQVRYLRYTMLGTQIAEEGITCPNELYAGCFYVDTVEVGVYGITR